jgi:DNA polymerase V
MSISVLPRRRPLVTDGSIASIHGLEIDAERSLPIFSMGVSAGFPSPAEDYLEGRLDLNEHLIPHPTSTFFVRAAGDSMIQAGIFDGDLLVVDRSIEQRKGRIVIASLHGEFTLKRLWQDGGQIELRPENENYESIQVTVDDAFAVWGVVTYVIHKL